MGMQRLIDGFFLLDQDLGVLVKMQSPDLYSVLTGQDPWISLSWYLTLE
jgi:hypothetical protein